MCLLHCIFIMLSAYQEVNDPYPGYYKNLEVKRSVARDVLSLREYGLLPCHRRFRVVEPEFEISASEHRTLQSELNIAGAERKTSALELKISALEPKISAQKKIGPSTRTVDLSFRDWDCCSRTPGQRSDRKSGASELKILVPKLEMLTPGLNIFSSGTENLGNTHDLSRVSVADLKT